MEEKEEKKKENKIIVEFALSFNNKDINVDIKFF